MYETVATVEDPAVARILVLALKAHGFHPREGGDSGLPGMPGVFSPTGIPVELPEDEAGNGRILAESLLKDMLAR